MGDQLVAAAIKRGDEPQRGGPDVIFASPTLSHSFSVHYNRSIMETIWLLSASGITAGIMVRPGDCFVDKARNKLVTDFLRDFPDTQNFFFLDDDIGWEAEAAVKFIRRPEDILAGAYPKKAETRDFPVTLAWDESTGDLIESQGLHLAVMAPTGFMRIKRHVLEALTAKAEMFEDITPDGDYASYHYVFESGRGYDGRYWGEDYTFCRKAKEAGFNIWVDTDIHFKHQGIRTWEDRLSNHLHVFRNRARAMYEGRDANDGRGINDLGQLQKDTIRQAWIDKTLDSAKIAADPVARAKFTDIEEEFWPLYDRVRAYTMTSVERLYDLYKTVEYVVKAKIPGAICECGVWEGGSVMLIALALKQFGDTDRLLQLYDTFEGLPPPDPNIDIDLLGIAANDQWKPGWAEARIDKVKQNMASVEYPGDMHFIKGLVEDTLKYAAEDQYAIARLDTDWYASSKVCVEELWPRIAVGGFLILDDYGHWIGQRKATDDFFADKPVKMTRVDYSCRVIQKVADDTVVPLMEAAQ
jgi:hypothetical protein